MNASGNRMLPDPSDDADDGAGLAEGDEAVIDIALG